MSAKKDEKVDLGKVRPEKIIFPEGKFGGRIYPDLVLRRVIEGKRVYYMSDPLPPINSLPLTKPEQGKK